MNDSKISAVDPKDFLKLVRAKYEQNPYGVSGFAFWKIEEQISKAATYQSTDSQNYACLYAIQNGKLVFYWAACEKPFMIPMDELKEFKLLSLHHRFGYAIEALKESHNINQYSPLSFEADRIRNESTNGNFKIATLDSKNHQILSEVANIINESTHGSFTSETIKEWTEIRVCDPELWVGALDKKSNELVGVGISTYNPSVQETDLDWFYIRKDYQGKRIGTMLVQETISRCRSKSRVIRVAGISDDFYTKCGFVRQDSWYYVTKKSTKVGWWD